MAQDEIKRLDCALENLKNTLLRHLPSAGSFATRIPEVRIVRRNETRISEHSFEKPLATLIVQGSKRALIGREEYNFVAGQSMVLAVDMPSSSLLVKATPEHPLLSIYFYISRQIVADLIFEAGIKDEKEKMGFNGVSIGQADADFVEGMFRLASLLDNPWQIAGRYPIIMRELHYLLLIGCHKNAVMDLNPSRMLNNKIYSAITYLREHLDRVVSNDELARSVYMSESSLYRHFKEFTGFSPLQYHKLLRLHEARRILMDENGRASETALRVGYESQTQFSREYRRLFGNSPRRDSYGNGKNKS